MIAALVRSVVYATLFFSLVLVILPARVLEWAGVSRPPQIGAPQIAGAVLVVLGGGLAVWCVLTFGLLGRGTPAVFDPPRRLVIRGPYQFIRNP